MNLIKTSRPNIRYKKKCMFRILRFSRAYCFTPFCLIPVCFFLVKKYESSIKIPGFHQNFQKYKKFEKRRKCFCAYDQMSQS
jgi:hypothetical protein